MTRRSGDKRDWIIRQAIAVHKTNILKTANRRRLHEKSNIRNVVRPGSVLECLRWGLIPASEYRRSIVDVNFKYRVSN